VPGRRLTNQPATIPNSSGKNSLTRPLAG
jgi:hypothetical protein